jgi:hypothetical protein
MIESQSRPNANSDELSASNKIRLGDQTQKMNI